ATRCLPFRLNFPQTVWRCYAQIGRDSLHFSLAKNNTTTSVISREMIRPNASSEVPYIVSENDTKKR
ncbi:hypothetical protein, partial [Alicyclobacillus fodiniaquatilis]